MISRYVSSRPSGGDAPCWGWRLLLPPEASAPATAAGPSPCACLSPECLGPRVLWSPGSRCSLQERYKPRPDVRFTGAGTRYRTVAPSRTRRRISVEEISRRGVDRNCVRRPTDEGRSACPVPGRSNATHGRVLEQNVMVFPLLEIPGGVRSEQHSGAARRRALPPGARAVVPRRR